MLYYDGYENLISGDYQKAFLYFDYMAEKAPANENEELMMQSIAKNYPGPFSQYVADYKAEAKYYRALTCAIAGDYESAINDFTSIADSINSTNTGRMLAVYLNPSQIYFLIGKCRLNMGNYQEARTAFERCLSEDFSFYMAHYNLSEIYYRKKNYTEALNELDAALMIVPNNSIMHYNKAYFLVQMEKYEDGLQEYEKAIELNPKNYRALYNAGFLCEALNNNEKAMKYFAIFLDNVPIGQTDLIAEVNTEIQNLKAKI
jgi:tetratricopeptide (TPR) repeat protein